MEGICLISSSCSRVAGWLRATFGAMLVVIAEANMTRAKLEPANKHDNFGRPSQESLVSTVPRVCLILGQIDGGASFGCPARRWHAREKENKSHEPRAKTCSIKANEPRRGCRNQFESSAASIRMQIIFSTVSCWREGPFRARKVGAPKPQLIWRMAV